MLVSSNLLTLAFKITQSGKDNSSGKRPFTLMFSLRSSNSMWMKKHQRQMQKTPWTEWSSEHLVAAWRPWQNIAASLGVEITSPYHPETLGVQLMLSSHLNQCKSQFLVPWASLLSRFVVFIISILFELLLGIYINCSC